MKIYGRNQVGEAITAGTTIDRLVIQKGQKDASANRIIDAAKRRGLKINFMEKEALDREVAGNRHQGFIAHITDYKYSTLDDIRAHAETKSEPLFVIIADGIEDPHNLGSILRVAECGGAHGVIIPDRRSVSVNETVIRVSAGAAAHVKVARVTNINNTIDALKSDGVTVWGADLGGESIYSANLTGATALVIGGEDKGIHALTRKKCDGIITIPMSGEVNSLNAAVACGVCVFERRRRCGAVEGR